MSNTKTANPDFETMLATQLDEALGEMLHPLFLSKIAIELSEGGLSDSSRASMTTQEARLAQQSLANALRTDVSAAA